MTIRRGVHCNFRSGFLICLMLGGGLSTASAATPPQPDLKARYEKAAEYLPWRIDKYVHGMSVKPNWSTDGRSFWYEETTVEGSRYWQVELADLRKTMLPAKPQTQEKSKLDPSWVPSPNGQWTVRRQGNQLMRIELASGKQTALTTDGVPDYAYGRVPDSDIQSLSKIRAGFPTCHTVSGRPKATAS